MNGEYLRRECDPTTLDNLRDVLEDAQNEGF